MSVPEAEIVTLPSEVMFQGARNVSETDASAADGTAAVTETTPWSDFVTCIEQLPFAPVVHELAPTNVAPPSAVKVTSTPAAGAPSAVAVTVIVADDCASTC